MLSSLSFQHDNIQPELVEKKFVSLRNNHSLMIRAGETLSTSLKFDVAPGHYVMANSGKDKAFLYTKLTMLGHNNITLGPPVFSEPGTRILTDVTECVNVFEDSFMIDVPITVLPDATAGIYLITGELFYQACDATQGYFPEELRFQFSIRIQ